MIEWENGAVCRVGEEQFLAVSIDGIYSLIGYKDLRVNSNYFYDCQDFQLNEIRIGDYIEKSELDTEQKYNDVVEVFGVFGFKPTKAHKGYEELISSWLCLNVYSGVVTSSNDSKYCKRKLTYNQVIAIGKLKRMMNEKSAVKSAPKTVAEVSADKLKTSVDYLNECIEVQAERGKQYDSSGTGERSFDAAAKAFNALTGEKLSGSDVCLLLTCLKVVRKNSDKSRLHDDSLLDGVSYLSLWAGELNKELK